jgi:hypothetical protein
LITGGPYTLAAGVTLQLADPFATTGGSASSIQVQNQSGFVLSVVANGEVYTIQSFTAQTIPLQTRGATLGVTPTSTISSGATNSLIVVWMVAGEKPDLPDGQLTAAAVAAAISGTVYTQSIANAFSVPLVAPAGGGNVSSSLSIPTSPPMHGALVSGVYTITGAAAAPIQITVTGNNTNNVYYTFINSITGVTNEALPDKLIPISAADTALIVALDSGGNDESCTVNINFYSQSIPPDPAVFNALIQGLFGNSAGQNVINPYVAMPLLQQVYNNQISTNWGIKVADALAPADDGSSGIIAIPAAATTSYFTAPVAMIVRSATISPEVNLGGVVSRGSSSGGVWVIYGISAGVSYQTCPEKGIYLPAGGTLNIYSTNAGNYVWGIEYTTL